MREKLEFDPMALLMGGGAGLNEFLRELDGTSDPGEMDEMERELTEEVEMKYLTLSWWMLHVGWKDVGERVRRGVEEVFDR